MPRAQTPRDLRCGKCEACIVSDGFITCMRCKQPIDIASAIMSGKWSCPKCPEHGEDPKTLAIDGVIECKFCKHKNSIPNTRVTDMAENAVPTLTEHYRNALLLELNALGPIDKTSLLPLAVDFIEKERIGLKNALAILDMGFNMERFREVLGHEKYATPRKLFEYELFKYTLRSKSNQDVKAVGFFLTPKQRQFEIRASSRSEGGVSFSIKITPEKICYYPDDSTRTGKVIQIIIDGSLMGLPIRVTINKNQLLIRGGDKIDSVALGNLGNLFHYSVGLNPPSQERDIPED